MGCLGNDGSLLLYAGGHAPEEIRRPIPIGRNPWEFNGSFARRCRDPREADVSHPLGLRIQALVNAGSARESFAPIGSNLSGYDNYFCRDCRRIVHVRKGSPGFRACPTRGCTRQTGFGAYAKTLRPLDGFRIAAERDLVRLADTMTLS